MSNKPVILLGAGGHALVVLDLLKEIDAEVIGYVSPEENVKHRLFEDLNHLTDDEQVLKHHPQNVVLVNGIGGLPGQTLRRTLFLNFKQKGYDFATLVHPTACVSRYAQLAEGVQVMPGCVINAEASIGKNSIVNTRASIDHDCQIGDNNHLAPGVILSGAVVTGENVHIGTGASVIQSIKIDEHSTIGAGAVITKDVAKHSTVYPARSTVRVKR